MEKTCGNGSLRAGDAGRKVTLIGWVSKRRNLGSLVFIDLRDRSGIVQITFDEKMAAQVQEVRNEYILSVTGTVQLRKDANPKMATGEVEIHAEEVTIVNSSEALPIDLSDNSTSSEDTRLKYRYLDLRRPSLQANLILRHKVCMIVRSTLDQKGFIEVETPILAKSTPEGARDYLVPSRIYNGKFWALPQSPQIYKQLLMIGGMEKYFQIARCFRDEDLRADRQPEFTQIDIEMSFGDEDTIFAVVENLMHNIFKGVKNHELEDHFIRIPWIECMKRFGSDKPDMRFGNEIQDITSIFENTEFQVFRSVMEAHGMIGAVKFSNAADKYSRKGLDALQEFVKHGFKAKALAYLKMNGGELSGSIAKPLSDEEKKAVAERLDLQDNDLVLVIADQERIVETSLGALRVRLAHELDLIPQGENYKFLWVTEFPMFEYSEEEHRWVAAHHPFTAPKEEDVDKLLSDPAHVSSRAYDLVCNGYELLSGSIRIHDQQLQKKVFEAIGLSPEKAQERFGFFLDAFKYGTPPHGGVGIGLERLTMILAGTDNIRDVVAFPTTNSSFDLMSEAPGNVDQEQLDVLGIETVKKETEE
ncbi:MAG: aspartate--tRNA ligase [Solobacterium sp.]|jgi:aspartyl-tRNA synthetase|nr:aspartate--tRNA ligase [Solobacterium sp.]MCH4205521.1 aspartate--tRNA ligase [Solobacterium sp.]MCH4227045.1 aspartate--tRNA ligase [Solobacterium sp.]MCH4282208.1 aspartate--tRNA ligase [Solobacterium sp.]